MNTKKRFLSFLMCIILILPVLLSQVYADDLIDLNRKASLTLDYHHDNTAIPDMEFDLYYVASCTDLAEFSLTEDFADCGLDLTMPDAELFESAPADLAEYINSEIIFPLDYEITDSDGKAFFTDLTPGLYLVMGDSVIVDDKTYTSLPFLVRLPECDNDSGEWQYDVTASPKPGEAGDIVDPMPFPDFDPILPQTGLLWWPVPVMLTLGLLLIIVGVVERKFGRDD